MLAELKPVLTALVMPPTIFLLLIVSGLWLAWRRRRGGLWLIGVGVALLWLVGCSAVSLWLSRALLPSFPMANAQQIRAAQVQAIVVMGAGVDMDFPDGVAQLQRGGLDRLRKGMQLSRATGIPILYTGGRGWGSKDGAPSEAAVAARVAEEAFGLSLQWQESESRDTRENALLSYKLLAAQGVTRIALVTDSWHMPRSMLHFQQAGFTVIAAPMGQASGSLDPIRAWLPSAGAMALSTTVLREKLALLISAGAAR